MSNAGPWWLAVETGRARDLSEGPPAPLTAPDPHARPVPGFLPGQGFQSAAMAPAPPTGPPGTEWLPPPAAPWADTGVPPLRRARRRWVLLAVVAGVVLLGVIVAAFVGIAVAPKAVATRYLSAIERDDTAQAYSLLCPSLQGQTTPPALRRVFAGTTGRYGPLTAFRITGAQTSGGTSYVDYAFTRTSQTGLDMMTLSRVKGQWKVCGNITISTSRRGAG